MEKINTKIIILVPIITEAHISKANHPFLPNKRKLSFYLPPIFYISFAYRHRYPHNGSNQPESFKKQTPIRSISHKSGALLFSYINFAMMERNSIIDYIRRSGVSIDSLTLNQTIFFIESNVGQFTAGQEQYEILSAIAIIGETILLDDITYTKRAKSGITLEHIMRQLGKLSKEKYLVVLTRQVEKWREAPLWLKNKTKRLEINYRIYKKYRSAFDELCQGNSLMEEKARYNLMAIFWILYLYVKHENSEFQNTIEAITLLHAVVKFAISQVLAQMGDSQSIPAFNRQFPESRMPEGDKYDCLRTLLINKLNEIHVFRYKGQSIDLQQLATDTNYAQRYLDDISNLYEKFKERLPENTINEISFLELTKNLTPLLIRHQEPTPAIQKKINFDDSDDDDQMVAEPQENHQQQEETAVKRLPDQKAIKSLNYKRIQPVSPFRPFTAPKGSLTPVSARHQNLSWVNNITSKVIEQQANQVKKIYEKYTKKSYKDYQTQALNRITEAICEFTPQCMDFSKRQRSIYHFFEHFINQIAEVHSQSQLIAMFSEDTNFNSILCLAVDLFNFAYQSLQGSYRKYCKIFNISLLQGHKPINWFGKNVSKPKNIEDYLYELEKKILIEEIWEDNEGYLLLSNQTEMRKYHNQALLKRLYQHTNERTQELCEKMKIEERQVMRVINLVKFILEKRSFLLKNHRIDQIIVCSIASILSINRSRSRFTLQEIFSNYNQLILSFYSNKNSLYDQQGNQIDLIDFYNNIFLPSVQEIVNNEEHAGILATPIRLQRRRSKQMGVEMTPIPKKFKQPPSLSLPPRKMSITQLMQPQRKEQANEISNSYRSLLAHSLKNMDNLLVEQLEQQNQDYPSPSFGGNKPIIYRTYSFGDPCDKP